MKFSYEGNLMGYSPSILAITLAQLTKSLAQDALLSMFQITYNLN